jgi:hypothetical protein
MGVIARNVDFLARDKGAPAKRSAMIALPDVNRVFADDTEFLRATHTHNARGLASVIAG